MRLKLCRLLVCLSCVAATLLGSALTAETFRNPQRIVTPVDPAMVVAADLNGDGTPDFVYLDRTTSPVTLHVLLSQPGGGWLPGTSITYPASNYGGISCVFSDVNRDGREDLVCATGSQYTLSFDVFPGQGGGTFASPIENTINASSDGYVSAAIYALGDLNADGFPDFYLQDGENAHNYIVLSDGNGGIKTASSSPNGINEPVITSADVNGDGIPDLLYGTGPEVALGRGDGTFHAPVNYASNSYYDAACIFHDMDGDGYLDAVCGFLNVQGIDTTGGTTLIILHGNPDGSFNTTPIVSKSFGGTATEYDGQGTFEAPIAVADLNGDGNLDILGVSGDGLAVILGGPSLTFSTPLHYARAEPQFNLNYKSEGTSIVLDVNGDGIPDLVDCGPHGLYISYGQSDGSYRAAFAPEVTGTINYPTIADFNGDGIPDVVATGDPTIKLSLGKGDGTFGAPVDLPNNQSAVNFSTPLSATNAFIAHGDFNGDGKLDLLAVGSPSIYDYKPYLLLGKGDGTFGNPTVATISGSGTDFPHFSADAAVVDINHDGRSDVFGIAPFGLSGVITFAISNGDGTFKSVSTTVPSDTLSTGSFTYVAMPALADFNGDGHLDAVYGSYYNTYVVRGHGDGTFDSTAIVLPIPATPNGRVSQQAVSLAAADFDGDGKQDFIVLAQYAQIGSGDNNPQSTAAWVYYGKGDGTFSSPVLAGLFDRLYTSLAVADLNQDHLTDVVLTANSLYGNYTVGVIHGQPNRTFGPEINLAGGTGLTSIAITDLNNDGLPDIVLGNGDFNIKASSVTVLLNLGNTPMVTGTLVATPEPSTIGSPFTLTATLQPPVTAALSGTIVFSVDGSAAGSAAIVNNAASLTFSGALAIGQHSLQAYWSGNTTYPAVTLTGTHTVVGLPTSITLANAPSPSKFGDSVTFTHTLSTSATPSPAATGTLTLADNGGAFFMESLTAISLPSTEQFTTSTLLPGTHTIAIGYSGDANYASSSASVTQVVNTLPTSMNLNVAPNPATAGQPTQITATLSTSIACPGCSYSGSVQFSDGSTSLGSAPVSASGVATLTNISLLAAGSHSISASFPGDAEHQHSQATFNEIVTRAVPALSLASTANPSTIGQPVTFTAHLGLPFASLAATARSVTFMDGNTSLGTGKVDGNGNATISVTSLAVGSHTITATVAEDALIEAGSASLNQVVNRLPTSILLAGTPNPVALNYPITFTAQLSSTPALATTGTVQFLDGTTPFGASAIVSGVATLTTSTLSLGLHTITAAHAGNADTAPSTSTPLTVNVILSDFTLTSAPSSLTLPTSHHITFTVTATSIGNFKDKLVLSSALLPNHMTVRFTPGTIDLTGPTAATSVYLDTDDVIGYASLQAPRASDRFAPLAYACLALPFMLLATVGRRRPRLLLLALIGCIAISLTACSGKYPASTTPGPYIIYIHAAGVSTSLEHTLDLPVNVTK